MLVTLSRPATFHPQYRVALSHARRELRETLDFALDFARDSA
jgi:hypothetical protein